MKYTILLSLALLFASCGEGIEVVTNSIQSELDNHTFLTYENSIEDFKKFTKEFEVIIADSVLLSSINKSSLSYAELETRSFIDTNGLIERIPNKALFGGGEYELNSYFEFEAGDEIFESSIIYYFNYDSTSKGFVIVDMMMAG